MYALPGLCTLNIFEYDISLSCGKFRKHYREPLFGQANTFGRGLPVLSAYHGIKDDLAIISVFSPVSICCWGFLLVASIPASAEVCWQPALNLMNNQQLALVNISNKKTLSSRRCSLHNSFCLILFHLFSGILNSFHSFSYCFLCRSICFLFTPILFSSSFIILSYLFLLIFLSRILFSSFFIPFPV